MLRRKPAVALLELLHAYQERIDSLFGISLENCKNLRIRQFAAQLPLARPCYLNFTVRRAA